MVVAVLKRRIIYGPGGGVPRHQLAAAATRTILERVLVGIEVLLGRLGDLVTAAVPEMFRAARSP